MMEVNAQDSVKISKQKSGYQNDLDKAIGSLITFLMIQDDEEAATFLRTPRLDSISHPWYEWKRTLNDEYGLQLNISYSTTNQFARTYPQEENEYAGSGFFKFYSRWTLVNRHKENNGVLAFGFDHRHAYSEFPPGDLGFQLGYNGIPALLFSDAKLMLIDLNWQQKFNKGRTGIIVGRYDPNDYFDVLGYVNPFTTFQNLAILLNPSIALHDLSTGIGIGHWINNQFEIQFTVNDANGVGTEVNFFEDFSELYTSGEISLSPSRKDRFYRNFHITTWHIDERVEKGLEESKGVAIGANWTFFETIMPYFKAGWSTGSSPIYSEYYGGGFIFRPNVNKDLFGIGASWGLTQNNVGQFTSELFYRFQFTQNIAITPSLQFLNNPALDDVTDSILIFGLRGRVAL